MKIKIYHFYLDSNNEPQVDEKGFVDYQGEMYDNKTRVADHCWHLCNWSCWSDSKPDELESDLDVCNSDVAFDIDGEIYMAQSFGWVKCESVDAILAYVPEHCHLWKRR